MSDKLAKAIFYVGTLVSLVLFLGLTVDTQRQTRALTHAERLTPQVVAGKRIWHKYNCNDCHTVLGFGSYYGPDLTKAYWRRGADGIAAVVRSPEKYTTWRKMPRYALADAELANLVEFLKWTSDIDTHRWPPQDQKYRTASTRAMALEVTPGAALFLASGCFGCHQLHGNGGDVGPDLTHVGARLDQATIEKLLADPPSVNPGGSMPAPELSPQARAELARFLAGLR